MYQETSAQRKKPKATPAPAAVKAVAPEISFTVGMSKPWTHLLEVEMRIKWERMPSRIDLVMPTWTPGSYLIREYARHVEDFAASDVAGSRLNWRKSSKNVWQVDTAGTGEIAVRYNVYSNELTVRTNELNDNHAFFNPSALLMHPRDQIAAPSTVRVVPYGDWRVATGLRKLPGEENLFRAENFDVLYDSPFEVGNFKEYPFTVQGKPHRFVVNGDGNYNPDRIINDTKKIIEECYKIFGDLPYEDYTFILNLRGSGGLEHANSTALQWNRLGFSGSRHNDFIGLVAHEFFHIWNVKNIRPDVLGPFDYTNENYTRLLWIAEGATSYYEGVLMRRAGLISDREFLASKATMIQALQERPGRFETSLEEASFDAWIKYYRPDANSVNNQVSYYDKGDIVAFLLDIEIRAASKGAKSLDDVFRELYRRKKNYTPEEFQKVCEMMAGKPLEDFFSGYVRGRDEIDFDSIVGGIGLKLNDGKGREFPYLGANVAQTGERLNVTSVPQGTPAYEQGLNVGDQIVAIDGMRANQQLLQSYLNERKIGDKVVFSVFRFDELREITVTLGGRPRTSYSFSAVENPTDEQRALYQGYLFAVLK